MDKQLNNNPDKIDELDLNKDKKEQSENAQPLISNKMYCRISDQLWRFMSVFLYMIAHHDITDKMASLYIIKYEGGNYTVLTGSTYKNYVNYVIPVSYF